MNYYQILTIVGSIAAFVIGGYLYQQHSESRFHKVYATAFVFTGLFSFTLFGFSISPDQDAAWMWLRLSAIVHVLPPITLHAILLVAKSSDKPLSKILLISLYLPFVLFIIQDSLFIKISYEGIMMSSYGWGIQLRTNSPLMLIHMMTYFICIAVQAFILIRILLRSDSQSKKKFATFVSLTYLIPIFICAILVFIVPSTLRMESIFILLLCITTVICLYRLNIFDLSINIVSRDIISGMSNFLIIVNQKKKITDVSKRTLELTGYSKEGMLANSIESLITKDEVAKIFQSKTQTNVELDIKKADGKQFPAIISVAQIIKKNEFLGNIIIGSDLTNVRNIMEEKKIIELELKALVRQMNPHFLFNSLNGLQHFILKQDEIKANDYITKFATLMRNILHSTESEEISLGKELENIGLYLELEHLRFQGKFDYKIELDESIDTQFVKLPTMMIQPFLENAIWHGLLPKEPNGLLKVNFTMDDYYLYCVIEDNGIGRELSGKINQSIRSHHRSTAIKNIRERIELLNRNSSSNYPMNAKIIDLFDDRDVSQGTRVELHFPIKALAYELDGAHN